MFDLANGIGRRWARLMVVFGMLGVLGLAMGIGSTTPKVMAQGSGAGEPICSVVFDPELACSGADVEFLSVALVPEINIDCVDSEGYKVRIEGDRCGGSPSNAPAGVTVTCGDGSKVPMNVPAGSHFDFLVADSSGETCLCQEAGGIASVKVLPILGTQLENLKATIECCECDLGEPTPTPTPDPACVQGHTLDPDCARIHFIGGGLEPSTCTDAAGYDVKVSGIGCGTSTNQMQIRVTCDDGSIEPSDVTVSPGTAFSKTLPCACAGTGGVESVRLSGSGNAKAENVEVEVTCCDC